MTDLTAVVIGVVSGIQAAIVELLGKQANAIDTTLAGLGLAGRVTEGDVIGNEQEPTHGRYLWKPSSRRPTFDQVGRLTTALPMGATWEYKGGGKLLITIPLVVRDGS